jgi:hypothetical protein
MRHLVALLACVAVLAGSGWGLDAIAARSASEGTVWVFTPGPGHEGLKHLLAQEDVRVIDAYAGGRLVQLHVDSLRGATWPRESAWAVLRLPQDALRWPGCG